jgi:ubiquitin C-terminal hydrolase
VLLAIARSSPEHASHIAASLSDKHTLGDIDIIGQRKRKKKRSARSHVTSIRALFDSDDDDDDDDWYKGGKSTTTSKYSSWKSNYSSWATTKSDTGFVGLDNLACICYMNSSIQNLYMVPEFRAAILNVSMSVTNSVGTSSQHYSAGLFYQFQRLLSYLCGSEKRSYNPRQFCGSFPDLGNTENNVDVPTDVYQQHDATEFVLSLFNKLKDSLVGTTAADSNILGMFMIDMFDEKTATAPDGEKKQALLDAPKQPMLRLNIEGHTTIVRALDEEFRGTEVDFRWEGEKESLPTIKRPTIKTLPDTLIIALNRFKSDYTQDPIVSVKINDRVEFPLVLDMNPYTVNGREKAEEERKRKDAADVVEGGAGDDGDQSKSGGGGGSSDGPDEEKSEGKSEGDEEESEGKEGDEEITVSNDELQNESATSTGLYELCGITIHSGNAGSGHYWSYAKDRQTEEWSEFNDDTVTRWDIDDLERDCFGGAASNSTFKYSQNAYMLYYRKKSMGSPSVPKSPEEIPSNLLEEIVGQNRVNAKKQSLVNFEYFEFVDGLLSSSQHVRQEGAGDKRSTEEEKEKKEEKEEEEKEEEEERKDQVAAASYSYSSLPSLNSYSMEPANEQMTKYNLTFLLGAFVHSGKDMLSRIEGTKESKQKASSNSYDLSDSDDDNKNRSSSSSKMESKEASLLSPMQVWHDRLVISLNKHKNVAAWFLDEMNEITCSDPSKFDRILKLSSSSLSSSLSMTMATMARSIIEKCISLCSQSSDENHVRSIQRLMSTFCERLVQWGKNVPDSEKSSVETKVRVFLFFPSFFLARNVISPSDENNFRFL